MKLLYLDTDNPALVNALSNTAIRRTSISDLKDQNKREQALDELNNIVILMGSISAVLETVDGQYVELKAQPEGASLMPFAQASGKKKLTISQLYRSQPEIFSQEVSAHLAFLIQKNRERDKEDYSWYRYIEKMVPTYNEILAVYKAKVDKIKELDKHFPGEDRYSLTGKQVQECHDGIKIFAKSLEDLVHTYANDFDIRSEMKRQFSDLGDARLSPEQFGVYSKLMRTFGDFRVLKKEEGEEEEEGNDQMLNVTEQAQEDERKTEVEDISGDISGDISKGPPFNVHLDDGNDLFDSKPADNSIGSDSSDKGLVIAGIVVSGAIAIVLLNR